MPRKASHYQWRPLGAVARVEAERRANARPRSAGDPLVRAARIEARGAEHAREARALASHAQGRSIEPCDRRRLRACAAVEWATASADRRAAAELIVAAYGRVA